MMRQKGRSRRRNHDPKDGEQFFPCLLRRHASDWVIVCSKLPPLSSTVAVRAPIENPALHQGRTRTVPHVDGQYASYVYVPLKVPRRSSLYKFLREVIATAKVDVPTLYSIGISIDDASDETTDEAELRISLTRPIYLRAHQREEVKTAIRAIARRTTR